MFIIVPPRSAREIHQRTFARADNNAASDETSHYGELALHISGDAGSEVRFKDISLLDLTQRGAGLPPEITGPGFRKQQLTDLFYAEGIATGDLNRDGIQDVVAGPFYYLGPDYKSAGEIYAPETVNPAGPGEHGNYSDCFLSYVYDFNRDGWPDFLKINFEGAYLYINPRSESRHWDEYRVVNGIFAETTQLADRSCAANSKLVIYFAPWFEIEFDRRRVRSYSSMNSRGLSLSCYSR